MKTERGINACEYSGVEQLALPMKVGKDSTEEFSFEFILVDKT